MPYTAKLTELLTPKVPTKIDKKTMGALLRDRAFLDALIERHFIAKVWGTALGDWSKADPKNQEFLSWLMAQPEVMDEFLLAQTPSAWFARVDDSWNTSPHGLEEWKKVYKEPGLAGRWQTTKPMEMYLVKGTQNIFVCTQTLEAQRSVALRWFELTP